MKRVVFALDCVALSFLIFERMIGDTILANVILLGLALLLLIAAALVGLFRLVEQRTLPAFATLSVSSALIVYIWARFHFGTVPAGYGP